MNEFITLLNNRIQGISERLEVLKQTISTAHAELDILQSDLAGYEQALKAEYRREGIASCAESPRKVIHEANAVVEVLSKAEFARRFVGQLANRGATPSEVYKGFEAANVPITMPYLYALGQRLVKQGQICNRGGKWYPVSTNGDA